MRTDDTITLSARELAQLSPDQLAALLAAALEIRGTCVVRDAQGRIRYDTSACAGQYHETAVAGPSGGGDV